MKKCKRYLSTLLLICVLSMSNCEYMLAPMEKYGTENIAQVEAASATVTVKSPSKSVATKLHKQLYKGKSTRIRVKGGRRQADKIMDKLCKQIQKTNKQGIVFHYDYIDSKAGYSYYRVSKDNALMYMYSVKFVDKLYKETKKQLDTKTNRLMYQDYQKYKNESERMLHIMYDYLVYSVMASDGWNLNNEQLAQLRVECLNTEPKFVGYSERTTQTSKEWNEHYCFVSDCFDGMNINDVYKCAYGNSERVTIELKSFDEFKTEKRLVKKYSKMNDRNRWYYKADANRASTAYFKGSNHLFMTNREAVVYGGKDFASLSQAEKVAAISLSNYFACNHDRKNKRYAMVYDINVFWGKTGYQGMKTLYKNQANGVCQVYAQYEKLLMDQLGIPCWINSNYDINHAWTVVKAKNSKGKTLWIPFDYGIGPSERLSVSEDVRNKYLRTEKMRYKLYLRGIPGAPTKKNFQDTDFN